LGAAAHACAASPAATAKMMPGRNLSSLYLRQQADALAGEVREAFYPAEIEC
jgi:hypothetical protein